MKTIIPSFAAADRRQARRLTPIVQGVFAVSLLAGGGLAATTIFRPQAALTTPTPLTIPDLPPDPAFAKGAHASAGLTVEPDATAARWMLVKNRPVPAAPTVTPPTDPDQPPAPDTTPPAPPGSVDRIRFLGVIREARRMLALVSIEGRQRILAEGDFFTLVPGDTTQLKVVKVTAQELIINDGSADKSIKRAERTGLAVGTAAPGPAASATASGMLNNSMGVIQPPQYVTPPGISTPGMPAAQPINSRAEYQRNLIAEKERRLREESEAAENAVRDAKLRELKGAEPSSSEKSEAPR